MSVILIKGKDGETFEVFANEANTVSIFINLHDGKPSEMGTMSVEAAQVFSKELRKAISIIKNS